MKIIYSAYFCNPFWPSESMSAFKWLTILLGKYEVIVFTSKASADGIYEYYHQALPTHLKILTFHDDNFLKRKLRMQLHFGYFTFNKNVGKYIRKNAGEFDDVKLILHKNPTSFRYFTSLYKLNRPLVIGPVTGGLQVPIQIKNYFRSESVVNKFRGFDQWLLKLPVYRKPFQKADKILITLDYLRDLLPKEFSPKLHTFFETGISVDNEFFVRSREPGRPVRILWTGIMARYKGLELLVRAVYKLRNENIIVDVVGDGGEFKHIEKVISDLRLTSRIILHGRKPLQAMAPFYERADIFCFPTLTEAVGNVLLEAMKFGLPIVTIDSGGPKYICPDSGTFKIPITTVDEIIENIAIKLQVLIQSAELREKMGRANYDHCKATYEWDNLSKSIIALVEQYR